MVRSVGLVILVVLAFASGSAVAMAKPATPAASRGCDDLLQYWYDVAETYPGMLIDGQSEAFYVYGTPFDEMAELRTEALLTAAEYLNGYLDRLDEIEHVPTIVRELHEAYIGRLVLLSRLAQAHGEGRVLDAQMYVELIVRNADTIQAELEEAAAACGDDWQVFPAAYKFMWSDWWKPEP